MSYEEVGKTIHEAGARVDEKYFQSFVDFGGNVEGDDNAWSSEATAEIEAIQP